MNVVTMSGNLVSDPELRYTPQGTPVANFRIAVNSRFKNGSGELKEEVCYIDVTAFRAAEAIAEHLAKGRRVNIVGRLRYETWQNSDGQTRSKHRILANQVEFLGGKPNGDAPEKPAEDDEVPF